MGMTQACCVNDHRNPTFEANRVSTGVEKLTKKDADRKAQKDDLIETNHPYTQSELGSTMFPNYQVRLSESMVTHLSQEWKLFLSTVDLQPKSVYIDGSFYRGETSTTQKLRTGRGVLVRSEERR